MQIAFTIDEAAFKASVDQIRDHFDQAIAVSKNMIASMMKTEVDADIKSAGAFGAEYDTKVDISGDTITTTVDGPGASVFETGGTIHGKPLLWLPLSGTDAEGVQASSYGDKLFSVTRKNGGVPLLFSIKDRAPKYFGVPSVNIPKKFHVAEIQDRVMSNFPDIFERALSNG